MFPGNRPPTPPLSQRLTLTLTSQESLGQNVGLGRGRWAVSQKGLINTN